MSYTVIDDNGTIQVRASITSRAEMNELGKALARAEEKLPETYTREQQEQVEKFQKEGLL